MFALFGMEGVQDRLIDSPCRWHEEEDPAVPRPCTVR